MIAVVNGVPKGESVLDSLVWVKLKDESSFLKIKETLTRIGIPNRKEGVNTLYQSCHILHKQGNYAIVHFKQLFALDRKPYDFTESDKARLNTIVHLLREWGLCDVVDETKIVEPRASMSEIKVISFADKDNWVLSSKYTIGKRYKNPNNNRDE